MSRPSGLGRGLGALIPSDASDDEDATYQRVAVSSIRPNTFQPREHFDEATLLGAGHALEGTLEFCARPALDGIGT